MQEGVQLDSLPLTVSEKFPLGNGIEPAIAGEPAAKPIASVLKNIARRLFIELSPVYEKVRPYLQPRHDPHASTFFSANALCQETLSPILGKTTFQT